MAVQKRREVSGSLRLELDLGLGGAGRERRDRQPVLPSYFKVRPTPRRHWQSYLCFQEHWRVQSARRFLRPTEDRVGNLDSPPPPPRLAHSHNVQGRRPAARPRGLRVRLERLLWPEGR